MKKTNDLKKLYSAVNSMPYRLMLVLTPMRGNGHLDRRAVPLGCNPATVAKRLNAVQKRLEKASLQSLPAPKLSPPKAWWAAKMADIKARPNRNPKYTAEQLVGHIWWHVLGDAGRAQRVREWGNPRRKMSVGGRKNKRSARKVRTS